MHVEITTWKIIDSQHDSTNTAHSNLHVINVMCNVWPGPSVPCGEAVCARAYERDDQGSSPSVPWEGGKTWGDDGTGWSGAALWADKLRCTEIDRNSATGDKNRHPETMMCNVNNDVGIIQCVQWHH